MKFYDLKISEEAKKAVADLGFVEATNIQTESIPLILQGKDIIGFSQTGSGKTAAFGLPAIETVDDAIDPRQTQVLILCPTRELAMQAAGELHKFAKYKNRLHVVPIYGGQPISRQISLLRSGCQIVIGTPGRIMDHLRRKTLKLTGLKMAVLDEADEMLNMGFREDIETILSETPESRQTLLFSATMPREILEITGKYQKDPQMVKIQSSQMTVSTIEQFYFEVAPGRKKNALSLLLQYYQPKLSLIFCNTIKRVEELVASLQTMGYPAEALHGDMKQAQRTQVMNRFKNGNIQILVATDVASRGIDVNDIDIVFNFDLPDDYEYYVHRIGRTARAGKEGRSFTLVEGAGQRRALQGIARYTKSVITKMPLPLVAEIKQKNVSALLDELQAYSKDHSCASCEPELNLLLQRGMTEKEICQTLLHLFLAKKSVKEGTEDVPAVTARDFENPFPKVLPRKKRLPNAAAEKNFENVPMERVTISIGRMDKIAPKHILGAVAGESGLPGRLFGAIDIKRDYTTIDVPKEHKKHIVKSINNKRINGKTVSAK